jgi:hypothetical protein
MASPTPQSAPIREDFTNEYLIDYSSEHLYYELCQIKAIVNALANDSLEHLNTIGFQTNLIQNLLVEGFALHLRNIIDFLYPPSSPRPTDVVASDFCQPGTWPPQNMSQSLIDAHTRANKEIAHLTTNRSLLNNLSREWQYNRFYLEVKTILHCFLLLADRNKLGDQVYQVIDSM